MSEIFAATTLAMASLTTSPPVVPAVHTVPSAAFPHQRFVTWHPGPARCEGAIDVPITVRRPYNEVIWGDGANLGPVTLQFAVDESGRPLSIHQQASLPGHRAIQMSPALAASRFAPGPARQDCTIVYTPIAASFDEVPIAELASYVVTGQNPRLPKAGYERLHAGDECRRKTQPLVRVFPEYQRIAATPGVRDWALVGFDLTASGETRNVRIMASTGNAELDQASVTAMAESRYNAGEPRTGCSYPYTRNAARMVAPAFPDAPGAGQLEKCKALEWAEGPRLVYPDAYRKRSIEGWAVLKFDVAPWGAIGNVEILDAQPAQDFGKAAKTMLERARKQPGEGATECVTRVRYKMAGDRMAAGAQAEEDSES